VRPAAARLSTARPIVYPVSLVLRRSPSVAWVTTLVVIALITATKLAVPAVGARLPFLVYFAAVLYASAVGGRVVGLSATFGCAVLANYLFLGSGTALDLGSVPLIQTGVFMLEGLSMVALVELLQSSRERTTQAGERVAGLQRLTRALAVARTPDEVAKVVVERGGDVLGAKSGELVQTGGRLKFELGDRRTVAVPLAAGDRALGEVGFRFETETLRDEVTGGLLDTISQQAAQALDRAQSFEREVWLRSRLEMLSSIAAGLSRAATRAEVADVVVERGARTMGADTCILHLLVEDGSALELIAAHGVPDVVVERVRHINAGSRDALWEIVESGEHHWGEGGPEAAAKFPAVAGVTASGERVRAFWIVPLVVEGRTLGALGMGYHEARTFHAEKRRFVETFVQHCAEALLRALRLDREMAARKAVEIAHEELARDHAARALVAEVTAALSTSLEYTSTLANLAALLVPKLADWASVDMVGEETGSAEPLAVAHVDPASRERAWEMRRRYPADPSSPTGVPNVLRTGKSEIYTDVTDEMIVLSAVNEEHAQMARALKLRSAMIVPLVARGVTLGALTVAYAESDRRYTTADLALVEEIARHAAVSVDNARLYGAEQRARATADEANRLKDEFLATVSHELRTPLNAILGWSRMISTGLVDEARRTRALETIDRNAVAMAQLIEDLLDVSRIISGKMRLEIETLDLTKVVEAAIDSIRPAALAKEIVIRSMLEPAPGPVLGDPNRMQQVVWNLLSNAVKFTPRGGRVEVLLRRVGSHAELCVSDTGAGIAAEFVPHVFDRFRQADGKITRAHGGLGLGLAITRQLVELHGGSVQATSEGVGHGAVFTVRLPVSAMRPVGSELNPRTSTGAHPKVHVELRGLRLLAVDDDEDSRRLLQSVLETAGASVTLASSVDEAMEAFDREVPDVLLSDIGMPGKDGLELIRLVRARSPERGGKVPAAALTAYARGTDRTRVLSAGFLMHLPKPIEPDELVAVVASLARFTDR
jgi:signal transduction histidine kinase/CheY-like chemotaxis protein